MYKPSACSFFEAEKRVVLFPFCQPSGNRLSTLHPPFIHPLSTFCSPLFFAQTFCILSFISGLSSTRTSES